MEESGNTRGIGHLGRGCGLPRCGRTSCDRGGRVVDVPAVDEPADAPATSQSDGSATSLPRVAALPPSGSGPLDELAPYQPPTTCSPSPKPGVVGFRNLVLASFPATPSFGISRDCSARAHIPTTSTSASGVRPRPAGRSSTSTRSRGRTSRTGRSTARSTPAPPRRGGPVEPGLLHAALRPVRERSARRRPR
jgi:hypothetical protein